MSVMTERELIEALPETVPRRRLSMSMADREALGIWAAAHLSLLVLVWVSAWAFRTDGKSRGPLGWVEHWDAILLRKIAAHGYFSGASDPHGIVFFPGYPVALAAVHAVLQNWVVSELVLSGAAMAVAMVAITRLAGTSRAALVLATFPAGVFLMVGYSESLFLALAIPAWLTARRGRWPEAAILALLAGLVRPDGVWLTAALVVMAATGLRGDRLRNSAIASLGLLGPLSYEIYLRTATGTWWAWPRAHQAGWDMHLTPPWKSWQTTWWAAFEHPFASGYDLTFQVELGLMVVMVAAAIYLGLHRLWPEMTFVALAAIAVGTQTWYAGLVSRTLLVLFPVAIAIAGWPRWARWAWLSASVPLAVVTGLLFLKGQWAG